MNFTIITCAILNVVTFTMLVSTILLFDSDPVFIIFHCVVHLVTTVCLVVTTYFSGKLNGYKRGYKDAAGS